MKIDTRTTRWLLTVLLLVTVPACAQQPAAASQQPVAASQQPVAASQQPVATLKISTRVVGVSAVVLDAQGLPVRDLAKDAFSLKQDGRPIDIRYFSEDSDLPLTLALLVDTSGSEKAYLEDEVRASETFFRSMLRRPTDRAALFQFDLAVRQLQPMTPAVTTLINSLNFLTLPHGATMDSGRGGTRLYDAILAASRASLGRERGRRAMVILTDGADVGSQTSLEQAIAEAQKADAVVYSVMIGAPEEHVARSPSYRYAAEGSLVMKEISAATGGRLFTVSRQTPLRDIYELIEEDMRLQYQLGYTPPPDSKPGSYHKLELKVQGAGKMTVQSRKGFYMPQ